MHAPFRTSSHYGRHHAPLEISTKSVTPNAANAMLATPSNNGEVRPFARADRSRPAKIAEIANQRAAS
jgi:hypothetical protein